MSYGYGGWAPYVPVAVRRERAARTAAKLLKKGQKLAPVWIVGRRIATSFWGQAWCDAIESYRDYENRLPRGRTYVRNGSVIDLQILPGRIDAMVSGSEMYRTSITVAPTPPTKWKSICADCTGRIESLVELLQGRFSKPVMERLCSQDSGLFPKPSEIRFACSCPDSASMCKHVAAVLYGVGSRLDLSPDLLFRLRGVDETALLADLGKALPGARKGGKADKTFAGDDLAALFDIDMADSAEAAVATTKASTVKASAATGKAPVRPAPKAKARAAAVKAAPAGKSADRTRLAAVAVRPAARSGVARSAKA